MNDHTKQYEYLVALSPTVLDVFSDPAEPTSSGNNSWNEGHDSIVHRMPEAALVFGCPKQPPPHSSGYHTRPPII